ncbi:methyltransferase (plasmid) [Advenella sp. S44]|uniref:MgtC/SapB family protein n=1 Tax=Advenella sp. S44 TaxID=1982755 RepID=UPI000C29C143|nr:MgtC/SapB family protein [Advenella sp. S44]PJX19994.1 methyltransferase [Advenella sp. S44]
MKAFANIQLLEIADTLVSLTTAFIMGSIIGFERQYRQRTAGLRTNVLVSVGAAIFVDMAFRIAGHDGAVRVIAYVVSGVGFLGAGVIMREEGSIRGLNTAATLWGSAAIGASAGVGLVVEAVLGTFFVLAANTLLRPFVNYINRLPVDTESSEITNTIHIITPSDQRQHAMTALEEILESANYPLAELDITPFGEEEIEIEATLMATSISSEDMDRLITKLNAEPSIHQAFWALSTSE